MSSMYTGYKIQMMITVLTHQSLNISRHLQRPVSILEAITSLLVCTISPPANLHTVNIVSNALQHVKAHNQ